jgi:hypothetical protein
MTSAALADAPKLGDLDSAEDWDALMMISAPEAVSSEPLAATKSESGAPDDGSANGEGSAHDQGSGAKTRRSKRSKKTARVHKARGDKYKMLQNSWHKAALAEEDGSWGAPAEDGPPPLVLRSVADGVEPCVLTPASDEGGFDASDVAFATQLMGGWGGGPTADERLLNLIYMAVRHFDVPYVRVVSGIRHDRKGSRHSHGLAADIVLPGVRDEDLAALFRAQGFVGVGIYPKAGFVHIDVRERSYFWVDNSAPGRKGRIKQVRAEEAKEADEAAMARGEGPNINPQALQRALNKRATARWKREKSGREKKREQQKAERVHKHEEQVAAREKKREEQEAARTRRREAAQAKREASATRDKRGKGEAAEPADTPQANTKAELAASKPPSNASSGDSASAGTSEAPAKPAKPERASKRERPGEEHAKQAHKREKPAARAKDSPKAEDPPTAQGG